MADSRWRQNAQNLEQVTSISPWFKNAGTQCPKRGTGLRRIPRIVSVLTIGNRFHFRKTPAVREGKAATGPLVCTTTAFSAWEDDPEMRFLRCTSASQIRCESTVLCSLTSNDF